MAIIWEIGGDAAREGLRREGLGACWYGLWWCVPLASVDGLASLHITCLELLELGLGVVITGPWLEAARRVRLVSDALVSVLVADEIGNFLSLIGSVCMAPLMFVLPPLVHLRLGPPSRGISGCCRTLLHCAIVVGGLAIMW